MPWLLTWSLRCVLHVVGDAGIEGPVSFAVAADFDETAEPFEARVGAGLPLSPGHEEGAAESVSSNATDSHLYQYPDWDELCSFDPDDLFDNGLYMLVVQSISKPRLVIWVGQEFLYDGTAVDRSSPSLWADKLAASFCDARGSELGLGTPEAVEVAWQGEEDDTFWDFF